MRPLCLLASLCLATLLPLPAWAFFPTGLTWSDADLPLSYLINERGSDDLSFAELEQITADSFAAWTSVPCTRLTTVYLGSTTLEAGLDEHHVISFNETQWTMGDDVLAAAGTTVLSVEPLVLTYDITFNGQSITWRVGGGGADPRVMDLQNVMTHEIGHVLGLSHTLDDGSATMSTYYLWDLGQRTLSHDDKAGICTLYPRDGATGECEPSADLCPTGSHCAELAGWWLCIEERDGLEAPCNLEHINCQDLCAFTALDFSRGFCTRLCSEDAQCEPEGQCEAFGGTSVCRLKDEPPEVDETEAIEPVEADDASEAAELDDASDAPGPDTDADEVEPAAEGDDEPAEVSEPTLEPDPDPESSGEDGCGCSLRATPLLSDRALFASLLAAGGLLAVGRRRRASAVGE